MKFSPWIPLVIAAVLALFGSVYVVSEGQSAIVLNLGKVVRNDVGPGLHFKIPFLESARVFDRRLQVLDANPERYLTSDKQDISLDFFAIGRISDVRAFYRATGGDEEVAVQRLAPIIKNALTGEINSRTLQEVVSGDREKVVARQLDSINQGAGTLGVKIIDIRIKRVDLPEDSNVLKSVYNASRSPASCAPKASSRRRPSAPRPTASSRCSLPKPNAMRRNCGVKAMRRRRGSMPARTTAIRRSTRSTAASRPTASPSPTVTP